jgi:tRNA threonylcarbamoyladenosine biosynthesis protein TsaB
MLLAIDTSTRRPGIALYDGVTVCFEASWVSQFHHTVELAPAVDRAMEQVGIQAEAISCLGVALGPGSFTALRIGLAFAKGLAMARKLPVVGVPSLDIVAASQPVKKLPLIAVLEAGRKRMAVGRYKAIEDNWLPHKKLQLMTPEELTASIKRPTLLCGEIDEEARRQLRRKWKNALIASPAQSLRRPSYLAELAWERWQADQLVPIEEIQPIYLSDHLPD